MKHTLRLSITLTIILWLQTTYTSFALFGPHFSMASDSTEARKQTKNTVILKEHSDVINQATSACASGKYDASRFLHAAEVGCFKAIRLYCSQALFVNVKAKDGTGALDLLRKRLKIYEYESLYTDQIFIDQCKQAIRYLQYRRKLMEKINEIQTKTMPILPTVINELIAVYAHDEEILQENSCVLQ